MCLPEFLELRCNFTQLSLQFASLLFLTVTQTLERLLDTLRLLFQFLMSPSRELHRTFFGSRSFLFFSFASLLHRLFSLASPKPK